MKNFVLYFLIFFCGHIAAADLFDGTKPRDYKLADPLELNTNVGGYPIWNGEGKWRLFNLARRDSTGNGPTIPIGDVGLFQTENKKFVALMWISATLAGGNAVGLANHVSVTTCSTRPILASPFGKTTV